MKVLAVTIKDYGAFYGDHEFRFAGRGLTMVLGENLDEPRMNSNGAAKSTLFECVDWCWYGKPPKEDHADSIINDEAKSCSVTTYLEDDDGTPATIKRARPNSLQIWIGGQERTALDTKETQRIVENFLGLERDVFKATVFFGQNDLLHFADVGDAKRVEILTKIIPELSLADEYLERVKERQKGEKAQLTELQTEASKLDGQLEGLKGVDFKAQQEQWEDKRRADRDAITIRVRQINDYVQQHQHGVLDIKSLEENITRLSAPGERPGSNPVLVEAEARLSQIRTECGIAQAEVVRLQCEIQKISQTAEGKCSQCGQVVTRDHLEREKAMLQLRLNEAGQKEVTARELMRSQEDSIATTRLDQLNADRHWEQSERDRMEQLNDLNQVLASQRQLQAYLLNAQTDLNACYDQLKTLDASVNPFVEEERKLEEKRNQIYWELEAVTEAVDQAKENLEYTEYWEKAFGPKGLKSYVLDSKLAEMTDAANYWVKLLTGGTFWIRFETQKKGRSTKKLTNELNVRVFRYNPDGRVSERNYKSWSGGEKKRVSLAIDFGLSRLVARRARKRYDLLILDELFKHVDTAGGEAIAEMLDELRREKSSIFVIEHDNDFKARFENRILVRRKNARSAIVELDHELSSDRPAAPRGKAKPKRKAIRTSIQA